jgi:cytochrome c biogenesis protein CcmG/thiol:disulfide interchange protein DsbE
MAKVNWLMVLPPVIFGGLAATFFIGMMRENPDELEHPNLEALREQGLPIYGVNYKDNPANALDFLAELGNPYEAVGQDGNGRMALNWGVYGVPETYVIDGAGRIVTRHAGPVTQRVIEGVLAPAIEKARAAE